MSDWSAVKNKRYRGSHRPIIPRGSGDTPIRVASYNVAKASDTATVFANNKGPLLNDSVEVLGDILFVKFASPVVIRDLVTTESRFLGNYYTTALDAIPLFFTLKGLTLRATQNIAQGNFGAFLRHEAVLSDWEPTTLTWANKPELLSASTPAFVTGANTRIMRMQGAAANGQAVVYQAQSTETIIHELQDFGLMGARIVSLLDGVVDPPTTTTFALSGGPYVGGAFVDDFGIGAEVVVSGFGAAGGATQYITDFDAVTGVFTVDPPFTTPPTTGPSVFATIYFPVYGVALTLESSTVAPSGDIHTAQLDEITSYEARLI